MPRSEGTVFKVPRRPSGSSRRPRVFVNGGAFGREISHTLPSRHADEVARLGALSPLGGHFSRRPRGTRWSLALSKSFGPAADFEEVSTRYGAWLDSQGVRTRRTSTRASSPKATEVEECVGAIRRLPTAWSDHSRWHTVIEGNFNFKEAIHMKEGRATLMCLRRACRGNGWEWSPLPEASRTAWAACLPLIVVPHAATTCSACVAVQLPLVYGADVSWTWRHGVILRTKGLDEPLVLVVRGFLRSSAQPLAPQHVSGALGVQVRVNPEPANPAKPAPSRFSSRSRCP